MSERLRTARRCGERAGNTGRGPAGLIHSRPLALALFARAPADIVLARALAGDVTGDGAADLVVGEHGDAANRGWVQIDASGAAPMRSTPRTTLEGPGAMNASSGRAVAIAGVVSGDGLDDLVVSSALARDPAARFRIVAGSAAMLAAPALRAGDGPGSASSLGMSRVGVGDADHDGFADGALGAGDDMSTMRRVAVRAGSSAGLRASDLQDLASPDGPGVGFAQGLLAW